MLKRSIHIGTLSVLLVMFLANPNTTYAQYTLVLPTSKQIPGLEFYTPWQQQSNHQGTVDLTQNQNIESPQIQTWNIPTPTSSPIMDGILVPSLSSESTPSAIPAPIPTIQPITTNFTITTDLTPPVTPSPSPTQSPTPKPSPAESKPSPSPKADNPGGLNADKLFSLVNAHRESLKLADFVKDDRACTLANSRAPEINQEIASDTMHSGLRKRNLDYWNSENIISMNSEQAAFNWWINDKIHRDAIEGNYKYSCVACSGLACAEEFTNFQPK